MRRRRSGIAYPAGDGPASRGKSTMRGTLSWGRNQWLGARVSVVRTVLICLILGACASSPPPVEIKPLMLGTTDERVITVPLVRLMANPRDFDGKRVDVTGVLEIDRWVRCLYLTREHRAVHLPYCIALDLRNNRLTRQGVAVADASAALAGLDGHYVRIEGLFEVIVTGKAMEWTGIIHKINFVREMIAAEK